MTAEERIDKYIDARAYRLQVKTWAEFNASIICTIYPKDSSHRAPALRSMLAMRQELLRYADQDLGRQRMALFYRGLMNRIKAKSLGQ